MPSDSATNPTNNASCGDDQLPSTTASNENLLPPPKDKPKPSSGPSGIAIMHSIYNGISGVLAGAYGYILLAFIQEPAMFKVTTAVMVLASTLYFVWILTTTTSTERVKKKNEPAK